MSENMSENIIPNEDVMRMAEKEEPRFLNLLLKNLDNVSDAISGGFVPSEKGKPGHFLISKNNFIYKMIFQNFHKYKTVLTRGAIDSLLDMQENGTEETKAAIKGYWDKIWNRSDVSSEDYAMLKEHINDRYVLWQFYDKWKIGDQIVKANSGHAVLVEDFIKSVNAINNLDPDNYSLTMSAEEGFKRAMKHVTRRRDHPDENESILTGIQGIDDIYHGFARGSYSVVSGFVGGGKTTLLINMSFNMAKAGYKVVYVSLEKDAELFFRRVLSLHALTDYNRIKIGGKEKFGLSDFWYNKLQEAERDLVENIKPNYHCLQFVQDTKLTKILAEVDKLKAMNGIDAMVVDYLQVIGFESSHPGRPDIDLANIHKRLMAYGRKNRIAVMTALQLKSASSKDIRNKTKKVTGVDNMSDITVNTEDYSGSQMIVADADNAMGVVLNSDKPATKMFISFSKSRDDESKRTICLDYDGRICRVADPVRGDGQIRAVNELIYNSEITKESLSSEDKLFDEIEQHEKKEVHIEKQEKQEKSIELPKAEKAEQIMENKADDSDGKIEKEVDDFDPTELF